MLVVGGFVFGLVVGRWWALIGAAGLGIWVALVTEVEVPHAFLGVGYSALAGAGIAAGVALQRRVGARAVPRHRDNRDA